MASNSQDYPEHLNPFGSDEDDDGCNVQKKRITTTNEYPEHLSPFGPEQPQPKPLAKDRSTKQQSSDDYDDSMNPFCGSETNEDNQTIASPSQDGNRDSSPSDQNGVGNPFEDESDDLDDCTMKELSSVDHIEEHNSQIEDHTRLDQKVMIIEPVADNAKPKKESIPDKPPVPLPRTKSLLKKEQALKARQDRGIRNNNRSSLPLTHTALHKVPDSLQDPTDQASLSSSSSSSPAVTSSSSTIGEIKKTKKRAAPPVPVNFKRQVSGSLDAIKVELEEIGDKLQAVDSEFDTCQKTILATHQVDENLFNQSTQEFISIIKRRNFIVRRQKELMYRKRELELEQIHSDIEYELRMIGNKQVSTKTAEDKIREEELLKQLVEIVEEKSDIENLNKDTSCDNRDIEEAFKRLNINYDSKPDDTPLPQKATKVTTTKNCDKKPTNKLSKIATLLPKGQTLKGTIKINRKKLFNHKSSSHSLEP